MKKTLLTTFMIGSALISGAQITNNILVDIPFTFGGKFTYVNDYHATIFGATPATDRFGHDNMAYYFDGVDDYMMILDPANFYSNFDNYTYGVSVSFWIKPETIPSSLASIITKWNGSTSEQYGVFMNTAGNNYIGVRDVNNFGVADSHVYTTGTWYHVVFTFNKATNEHKVYVNNVVTLTHTPGGTLTNTTDYTSISIGAQANDLNGGMPSPNRFLNATIDDIQIYYDVLTPALVDSLYNLPDPICEDITVEVINQADASSSTTNDGHYAFNVYGGYGPYNYTINAGSSQNMTSGTVCGNAFEGNSMNVVAPGFGRFSNVSYASYGTPNADCNTNLYGDCHALTSTTAIESSFIGQQNVTITPDNTTFGNDPCFGTGKYFYGTFSYSENVASGPVGVGNYDVVITDANGCSASHTFTISAPVSVNELIGKKNISVFPNPASQTLNIQSENPTKIEIYDVTGQVVLIENIQNSLQLNIEAISNGIYFVKDLNTLQVIKFVKE